MQIGGVLILHFSFLISHFPFLQSMRSETQLLPHVLLFPIGPSALISRISTLRPPTLYRSSTSC